MSAPDNTNPYQFQMFVPAGELADESKYGYMDAGGYGDHEEMAQTKRNESRATHDSDLMDSIEKHGVQSPVALQSPQAAQKRAEAPAWEGYEARNQMRSGKPMVNDGHHRIFSAAWIDPKMEVPVTYRDEGTYR